MEKIVLYFLAWTIIVIIILIFVPSRKIRVIGHFFKVVIPKLPITDIIKMFKK